MSNTTVAVSHTEATSAPQDAAAWPSVLVNCEEWPFPGALLAPEEDRRQEPMWRRVIQATRALRRAR